MTTCTCGHQETMHHQTNNWISGKVRTYCEHPVCSCLRYYPEGEPMLVPITPQQAREVQEVQVQVGKLYITATVKGRKNTFATVCFKVVVEGSGGASVSVDQEFSWDAIAHSINTGKPLQV